MKVLITGANGFVGGNVSRYLMAQGITCVALDVKGVPEQGDYSERYTWDDLDTLDLSLFDGVIHLAGKAHDTKNTSEAKSYFDVNVGLTRQMVSKCANARMRECANVAKQKFILFSSVKACADTVEGVLTEEYPPKPGTPYGQSKLEAESVVRECKDALACYVLRPAMIHGPGNKGNLNLLVKVVQKGIPWPLAAFENQRSFAGIDNVSCVLEALLKGNVEPGIYHVADDQPISTNRLISMIAEAFGRPARLWKLPCWLMRGVARSGDFLCLPLNSERLKKLTESYVVSNKKILKALGWQQMPVGAEEGMRATLLRPHSGRNGVIKRGGAAELL